MFSHCKKSGDKYLPSIILKMSILLTDKWRNDNTTHWNYQQMFILCDCAKKITYCVVTFCYLWNNCMGYPVHARQKHNSDFLESYHINYLWFKIYQAYKKVYKYITKQFLQLYCALGIQTYYTIFNIYHTYKKECKHFTKHLLYLYCALAVWTYGIRFTVS